MLTHPKVIIGIISYNDRKYLEQNIPALLKQDYGNFEIVICNNFAEPEEIDNWLRAEFPTVKVVNAGGNVGFGRAHNFMAYEQAVEGDAKYYLCFNSDMVASPDYLSRLVETAEQDERIGVVTGKLISWTNFPGSPAEIEQPRIDTTGLVAKRNFHIVDRGQGELDKGQYDQQEDVWGASGASPLFRVEMLKDVQHAEGEYFDKEFFMYKEDVDLAMRIRWADWRVVYTPKAVAWHDRTAADSGGIITEINARKERGNYIKRNSFLNQLLLTRKSWSDQFSFGTQLRIVLFILKYMLYLLIFDRKILSEYKKYKEMRSAFAKRGQEMPRRISAQEFEEQLC